MRKLNMSGLRQKHWHIKIWFSVVNDDAPEEKSQL